MNRKLILTTVLLTLSAPALCFAQAAATPAATASTAAPVVTRTPDQVLKMYSNRLSLTDDQKTKLKPIIADRQQQLTDLRGDSSLQGRQKLKKLKSIVSDSDTRINAILTPDQQKKYADMEAEQKEKVQERRKDAGKI